MTRATRTATARGFTLIEVMVVMVIIAILVTAVSLSLKGDRVAEALGEEAKRLTALLNLAREEAVIRDRDLGLVLAEDGYLFVQHEDERAGEEDAAAQYVQLTDDDMFRPRNLPPGTELRFEAQANPARAPQAASTENAPLTPRVLALANDMFLPQGVLILRNPATPKIERIAIEQNGARVLSHEAAP